MTMKLSSRFDKINKLDRDFITCLPPELIARDIAFIPSILERVQR